MRKFLLALLPLFFVFTSCTEQKPFTQTVKAPVGDIRALLIHLGYNMWCDWPTEAMGEDLEETVKYFSTENKKRPNLHLITVDSVWRKVTDYAAENGINMLVVDLGEGLQYLSHPELAVEGSWSPEKMQEEIRRLNALGMEVVPKLNFSTTHNGWMKDYRHMVSSAPYNKMCSEVIADVVEIFGHPRFFHIGYDEEEPRHQAYFTYQLLRTGEVWMKDFLYIVSEIEKHGARAWAWSDYAWRHPEYIERCPKSVIQQNWYYDAQYGGFDPATNKTVDYERLITFWNLEEAGFDQVPCGTNWVGKGRKELGVGGDDIMGKLVTTCRDVISEDHLYGFMIAPWMPCTAESADTQLRAIEILRDALK